MKNVLILLIFTAVFMTSAKSQDLDSSDAPITKKVGLSVFPFEEKIGMSYCFGKRGQWKLEDVLEPGISFKPMGLEIGSNETKLLYAWKSCSHKKLYSGIGLVIIKSSPEPDKTTYINSILLVPFGIEWHPLKRARKLGIIAEVDMDYRSIFGHVGLNIHF